MYNTHDTTKALLLQDYLCSGKKNLGEFALGVMKAYDDFSYQLVIINAYNKEGQKMSGTAIGSTREQIEEVIKLNGLRGDYKIVEVDCQKEFFCLLAEIRDEISPRKKG